MFGWRRQARIRGWTLGGALVLAGPALVGPSPVYASGLVRPDEPAEAEALLAQADADRAAGQWADAASAFDRAYRRLPLSLVPELGESTVLLAVSAYEEDATGDGGDAALVSALELLDAFERDLREIDPEATPSAAITDARTRLTAALPAPEPEPVEPPPKPVVVDEPTNDPDVLGWTLVGVGAAGVVGGVGALIRGSRMLPIAKERLAERGNDPLNPEADEAYLDDNRRRGRIVMGIGGALSVAGMVAVVVGAVRISRRRARPSQARLHPTPTGIVVRF